MSEIIDIGTGFRITMLNDLTRLPEIYQLRVEAWEASPNAYIINQAKYPAGFADEFDEDSIHLIALSADDEIVSACRLTVFKSMLNYPYIGLPQMSLLADVKFGLIGRGVRKPNIKAKRLQYAFVSKCLDICQQKGISYATGHAYNNNVYMQNLMLELDFNFLCDVNEQNYTDQALAHPGKLFIKKILL
jgi:predicted GNAT family N-acyltransferase